MEELYQSNLSCDMTRKEVEDIMSAGMSRDMNMLRALIQVQLNNLSNSYSNVGVLIGILSPEKREEFDTNTLFALQEVAHIVNTVLGDEKEVSFDPGVV